VPALLAPFLAAAAVIVLAGAAKTVRPANTARALRQLGWPGSPLLVRCLGVVEVLLGATAAVNGNRIAAALLALSYLGFSAFVAAALRHGGAVSSCGCFGQPDTPPTISHLLVVVAGSMVSAAVALRPGAGLTAVSGGRGVAVVLLAGIGTWLAVLSMTLLPRLRAVLNAGGDLA
jgi:methylamine utilization protein MauE